jgi:acetyl-CoA C-acetyltransferase
MSNVIVSFSRTPIGSFLGSLESVSSPKLGATAIAGAVTKANLDLKQITQVIMGSVLSAGVGQAPARQAAIYSGLSDAVNCLTINKMCGSGLESIILADQLIKNNPNEIIIAGGMENMSQAPHYLLNSRSGTRLGEGKLVDGMIVDGLWDIYNDKHMGNCAEMCAEKFSISREEQDDFAIQSYERSQASISNGTFDNEIVPVDINTRKGVVTIDKDEEPHRVSFEKLKSLRTVFQKDGTITAGNASTINDGAAACLIMSEDKSKELGMTPIARIVDYSSHSHDPEWFTTAPISSTQKLLKQQNIKASEIDIYEINEAFSVVTLAAMKELNLDPQKVNPYGGAVSLGHPIGASGARIMCTLLNAMISKDKKMGVSSICIGGGEALSILVERIK